MKISPLLAKILSRRGVTHPAEQEKFLTGDLTSLTHPFLIPNLKQACCRLLEARERKEKVFIYGDGDVDGVSAVTLLSKLARALEIPVESYLTHRLEEFEIEEELVENLADDGYALMLAADCGTSSSRALKKAALRSLQVVVLDHHLSDGTELPEEHLYINPHLDEWPEGVRRLSSSGIAYFFLQGMEAMTPGLREKGVAGLVEVAALGTLGDSVPLLGDNRIIVKEGLKRLPLTQLTGLRQFIENIGLGSRVKCLDVIMKINPRLNAPGRFGRPEVALKVFLEEEEKELPLVFREIEEYDRKRSSLIQRLMRNWPEAEGQSGAVTSLKDFPASLCGVVASRLVERTGRPAMVCARTGELIRGSARSAGDFDLYWRLCKYRENFISFGGHSRAVGFTLVATRLKELEAIWRETVADFEPGLARPSPEEVLPLERLTVELVAELNSLEPYGPGNPRPLFMEPEALVQKIIFHEKRRIRFWVERGGRYFQCFMEKKYDRGEVKPDSHVSLIYTPRLNETGGSDRVWLDVREVSPVSRRGTEIPVGQEFQTD